MYNSNMLSDVQIAQYELRTHAQRYSLAQIALIVALGPLMILWGAIRAFTTQGAQSTTHKAQSKAQSAQSEYTADFNSAPIAPIDQGPTQWHHAPGLSSKIEISHCRYQQAISALDDADTIAVLHVLRARRNKLKAPKLSPRQKIALCAYHVMRGAQRTQLA